MDARRCDWAAADDPLLRDYHDLEWGRSVHGERALFERITLEAFQSGLSWRVVLAKRPAFREAFAAFDPAAVAAISDAEVERLLRDRRIVRNRAKVLATRANASAVLALSARDGPDALDRLVWSFAPPPGPAPTTMAEVPARTAASTALASALRQAGLRFVGPTTAYALMQACGLVNDHLAGCAFRAAEAGQ